MFSTPDIAVIGILALLLFGPDKLPGMLRKAGTYMRQIQNTSHSFVAEMERAADMQERGEPGPTHAALPEFRDDEPPVPGEGTDSPPPSAAATTGF